LISKLSRDDISSQTAAYISGLSGISASQGSVELASSFIAASKSIMSLLSASEISVSSLSNNIAASSTSQYQLSSAIAVSQSSKDAVSRLSGGSVNVKSASIDEAISASRIIASIAQISSLGYISTSSDQAQLNSISSASLVQVSSY